MPFEGLGSAAVASAAESAVRLRAGDTTIEVAALAPDLFRVGVFPRGKPPRYDSGAIAKEDWPDAGAEWTGGELRNGRGDGARRTSTRCGSRSPTPPGAASPPTTPARRSTPPRPRPGSRTASAPRCG